MRLLRWPIAIHVDLHWPKVVRRMLARKVRPSEVHTVRLRHFVDSEAGQPDSLVAVLEFSDQRADLTDPDYVDLYELRSSLNGNGTFFIWTCSCGGPGCAGRFDGVRVTHCDGVTTWDDLDVERRFVFRTEELRGAYERGIIRGRELLADRPAMEPMPIQNRAAYRAVG